MKRTPRRTVVFSLTALTAGLGLMVAAQAEAKPRNWTFRVAVAFSVNAVDPALFFAGGIGPNVASAICANLYDYPDESGPPGGRLVPEVAKGPPRVSRDGRTYTFAVRRGFRFDNGAPVRAANFAAAINRDLDPREQSAAVPFLRDFVGATKVLNGQAKRASGVSVLPGDRLRIKLTAPHPDLTARLATPYFCSIPVKTKVDKNGVTPHTAGPYYVDHIDSNQVVLLRNPYYHGRRPRNPSRIVYELSHDLNSIKLDVERGTVDCCAGDEASAKQYPKRFHLAIGTTVACLALNNDRPLFKGNLRLRRAVNYAIDRPSLDEHLPGYPPARPTDQYLPPTMPGFRDGKIYPLSKPNLAKARALARGHLRSGRAIMYYRNPSATAVARARIVQYDLARIGLTVELRQSPRPDSSATRGEPFDIVDIGCIFPSYMDPAAILDPSFDGRVIQQTGNTNVAYFNDRTFNRRFAAAARLRGRARYRAYGKLDIDLARNGAPAVAYGASRQGELVSQRIGCVQLNPLNGISLGAVCRKRR